LDEALQCLDRSIGATAINTVSQFTWENFHGFFREISIDRSGSGHPLDGDYRRDFD
jgi:hypothetical protein